MVNVEKVLGLLRALEDALEQLRRIVAIGRETFLSDGLALGAAKYYLQTAIEACIDIGNHIISSEGYRPPKDYRDVFTTGFAAARISASLTSRRSGRSMAAWSSALNADSLMSL